MMKVEGKMPRWQIGLAFGILILIFTPIVLVERGIVKLDSNNIWGSAVFILAICLTIFFRFFGHKD